MLPPSPTLSEICGTSTLPPVTMVTYQCISDPRQVAVHGGRMHCEPIQTSHGLTWKNAKQPGLPQVFSRETPTFPPGRIFRYQPITPKRACLGIHNPQEVHVAILGNGK